MISVTMFKDKKGNYIIKSRDIIFSCDSDEARDKWIISIEYLKTKAIYDAYAAKNRNIGFNQTKPDDMIPKNTDDER